MNEMDFKVDLSQLTYEAPDFITNTVTEHPGEMTIVSIGVPTNIAVALQRHPEITTQIKDWDDGFGSSYCETKS